ncbi:hypothetical protein ACJX0J_041681, partial [Zea mays]
MKLEGLKGCQTCQTEVSLALFAAILEWLGRIRFLWHCLQPFWSGWVGMVARKLNFGLLCILFAHLQNMIILIYSYILNLNLLSVMYHFLLQGVTLKIFGFHLLALSLCFLLLVYNIISSVRINSYFLPTQYAQSPFFLTGFSWQGMYITSWQTAGGKNKVIYEDVSMERGAFLILEPIKFTQEELKSLENYLEEGEYDVLRHARAGKLMHNQIYTPVSIISKLLQVASVGQSTLTRFYSLHTFIIIIFNM